MANFSSLVHFLFLCTLWAKMHQILTTRFKFWFNASRFITFKLCMKIHYFVLCKLWSEELSYWNLHSGFPQMSSMKGVTLVCFDALFSLLHLEKWWWGLSKVTHTSLPKSYNTYNTHYLLEKVCGYFLKLFH